MGRLLRKAGLFLFRNIWYLHLAKYFIMKTVQQIIASKSAEIYAVSSTTSVFDALTMMMDKNISALLIMDNEQLTGIFTERDYARKVILQGKSSKSALIDEVMTPTPVTITAADSIDHCMALMTNKHIRHLPVLAGNKVIAMVSIGDIVKFIIEDQKQIISQLESYIHQ